MLLLCMGSMEIRFRPIFSDPYSHTSIAQVQDETDENLKWKEREKKKMI